LSKFWRVNTNDSNWTVPFERFAKTDVKSFMKINRYLKLENPTWELHEIINEGTENQEDRIISRYESKISVSLDFQDENRVSSS